MKLYQLVVAISVTASAAQAQQQYTVQPGDSLRQIAMRELGDVEAWRDLCALNDLSDCNRILAGQVLQLSARQTGVAETEAPRDTAAVSAPSETAPMPAVPAEPTVHVQNMVQNSRLDGAANGVIGAGGSLPDGWGIGGFQGAEIVQTGLEAGLPYIDLRLAGAPVGNAIFVNFVTSDNSVEVAPGQTWTSSAYVQRVGGDLTNIDNVFMRVQEFAGPDGKGSSGTNITAELDERSRAIVTREISDATATRLISFFRIGVSEGDIDVTLRISGTQVAQGDSAGEVQLTGDRS